MIKPITIRLIFNIIDGRTNQISNDRQSNALDLPGTIDCPTQKMLHIFSM